MESRKASQSKPSPLPTDYLSMVKEVFTAHFGDQLKEYSRFKPNPRFEIRGEIHSDEIILAVSLVSDGKLSAVTGYGSVDFDPKANVPSLQDLLAACVDGIGSVFETLLPSEDLDRIQKIANEPIISLEGIPLEWTSVKALEKSIFVRVDSANLNLDSLTDDWLAQHDPEEKKREEEIEKEVEKLFVTGKQVH